MTEVSLEVAMQRQSGKGRDATLAYRLEVLSRCLATIVVGFILASGFAMIISSVLAQGVQARGPATTTGTLVSGLFWIGGAIWAFYARRPWAAWASLMIPGAALGALAWFVGFGG